jgi:hypothetical protein
MFAGARDRRTAVADLVPSVMMFPAAASFARPRPLQFRAFMPACRSAQMIVDLITAAVTFGQLTKLRSRALAMLTSELQP